MQPIRLAVVGAGKLGGYHATLAAKLPQFELVAVVDPSQPARASLAEKTGARPVADLESVIGLIDAAVLATPTHCHAAGAVRLLGAAKHTLVEKPIAPTTTEADRMVGAAAASGAVLQVGHVERFNPALRAAGDALASPRLIQATRSSGYTFRSTDIGAVLDLMIHDIDLALSLADSPVVDVTAIGAPVFGPHEDLASAQLRFANGCLAQLEASRVSYELRREVRVFTATGFASLDLAKGRATLVRPTEEVLAGRFDAERLSPERKAELFAGKLFDEVLVKEERESPAVNAIELELLDFARAIQTGAQPTVPGTAGRDAVDVAERVIDALRRGATAPAPTLRKAG